MTYHDHPDWLALVAAMRADPDEDTVRLAAADWLDEHGEHDRAASIRFAVSVAPDHVAEHVWLPGRGSSDYPPAPGVVYRYRRGFAEHVTCAAEDWLERGDVILAAQPVARAALTTRPALERFHREWVDGKQVCTATVAGKEVVTPPLDESEDPTYALFEARWPGVAFGPTLLAVLDEDERRWRLPPPGADVDRT